MMHENKQALLAVVMIAFVTAGCSLAPKYTRPNAPIPASWQDGPACAEEGGKGRCPTPQGLKWQKFYEDPGLKQVVEMALTNNRDLRIAALNVKRARALYGVQRAELLPVINGSGSASKQRIPADVMGFPQALTIERYDVNLGISSWEIDFFGRIRSLKDKALEEFLATKENRKSAQIALVSEVARAYLTLAADKEMLNLASATLKNQEKTYGLILRQHEVGMASKLDVSRARTQVEAARKDVALYTQAVALDKNALNLLAGETVPETLLPKGLSDVKSPEKIFADLSSEVLLRRPDIIAAEHRLKAAYAYIGAARAAFFPRISLTTSIGTATDELSSLFGAGTKAWNFAPQIIMPIFDARTWAAYRVSRTEREIAIAQYEKAIQTAFKEVADALAEQTAIKQQIAAQQSLVKAVSETFVLASKRYQEGIESYLSVLDAQRSLLAAQQGLIMLRLAKHANQVRLYAVLGGGGE